MRRTSERLLQRAGRWSKGAAAAGVSVMAAAPVGHLPPRAAGGPAAAARPVPAAAPAGDVREVESTAYCLDGTMANGEPTHDGVAAMRGVPLGTSVEVLDGPHAGRRLVVKDRLPRRGVLDIWMDDCRAARAHGVRLVTIRVGA